MGWASEVHTSSAARRRWRRRRRTGAHLNGDLLARLAIDTKLDLGKVAGPESLTDLVLIDDRLVDVRVLDLLHQHTCAVHRAGSRTGLAGRGDLEWTTHEAPSPQDLSRLLTKGR